jgi:3-isopropylmalate dehydratase small subunit
MINYIKLSIAKEYYRIFYRNNANSQKADFVYNQIQFLQKTVNKG